MNDEWRLSDLSYFKFQSLSGSDVNPFFSTENVHNFYTTVNQKPSDITTWLSSHIDFVWIFKKTWLHEFDWNKKEITIVYGKCIRVDGKEVEKSVIHKIIVMGLIDQFRYIEIQPKTIDLRTRLWGINPTNSVFIPQSLVLRSIVWGWILIYRKLSIIDNELSRKYRISNRYQTRNYYKKL